MFKGWSGKQSSTGFLTNRLLNTKLLSESQTTMASFALQDKLDWTVSKRASYRYNNQGQLVQAQNFVVVRDDTDRELGSVSKDFEFMQNSDLLQLINPMVEEGLLTIENMGYLSHGAKVFAQAKINQEFRIAGDDYSGYITLLNGHTGKASVAIGPTAIRVICGNTFAMAYSELGERYRHTNGVTERALQSQAVINFVDKAMKAYAEKVEPLAKTRCSHDQFGQAVETIYGKDPVTMRTSFIDQLNTLFYEGKGNSGETFADAFNAITEYGSHYSLRTADGRFNYANFGRGSKINARAMEVLTEMAAV